MRRDCTRVSLIEDRRNEHGRQPRDRHTPYVHTYVPHVLCRALDPLSPTSLLLVAPPPRTLPMPPTILLFPAYARACENGKWEFVVSLTFEYSSSSRSGPQRNPLLSSCFTHPFSFCTPGCYLSLSFPPPSFFYTRPTKAFIYPVLRVSLRVGSPFHTVRPLRMNLTDDSWYEIVMSGRRTVGCRLFVSFFFFPIFLPLSPCQSFFIWSSLDFALFDTNSCFAPSLPSRRRRLSQFRHIRPILRHSILLLSFLIATVILAVYPRSKVLTVEFVMLNERKGAWLNLSRVDDVLVWEQKRMRMWRNGGEGGCVREWKVEGGSSDVAISEMAEISFTPRRVI